MTPAGKARSSLNAVKEGFSAQALLLPHESADEYEAVVETWLNSLGPRTGAERRLVLRVADADWRLQRVAKVERRLILAAVEETISEGKLAKLLIRFRGVHQAVAGLAAMTEHTSLVGNPEALDRILPAIRTLAHSVAELELPSPAMGALLAATRELALEDLVGDPDVPWKQLGRNAIDLAQELEARISHLESQLLAERERLFEIHALGGDREMKKLERHRQVIQRELDQVLGTLRTTRQLAAISPMSGAGEIANGEVARPDRRDERA